MMIGPEAPRRSAPPLRPVRRCAQFAETGLTSDGEAVAAETGEAFHKAVEDYTGTCARLRPKRAIKLQLTTPSKPSCSSQRRS